ncbi:MFS transporter [Amycolatopsis taiwanensis]|uniref:MFS transporter n=1 Tax=Amycolatopsis taiwanensis TaxID=342230 RepID=A0A9W6VCV6_9PSEU|nr:MFS transporter [Amycolatopsis taiwanensis]GLY66593.1 MFS transporter [Amycolatopsis taiwanensis]
MDTTEPTAVALPGSAGDTAKVRAALPPESARVGPGFIAAITGASFGTWLALVPATTVTLALRVEQVAPQRKAETLSLVLTVGAAVALVAQNIFGALSDRTTSRFGMRRPWIAAGALLGVASLGLLATASTVGLLVLAWASTQLTFNMLLAGLNPVLPDQVPAAQLGRLSAVTGLTSYLAIAGGAFLAQLFLPNLTPAILVPGVVCLVTVGVFLIVLRDRRLDPAERPPFRMGLLLRAYWVNPRKAPDFAWAWLSRFLVFWGSVTLTSYLTYFLMGRFGYTPDTIGPVVSQVLLINGCSVVLASLVLGALSDRMRRRKPFVLTAGVVSAGALVLAALSTSLSMFFVATAIGGIAAGCYVSVDQALVAEVLPSRTEVGKDMGVFHLANVLPQTLVPAVAPLLLAIGGHGANYSAFFITSAVVALVGALCILRVRSVR